MVASSPPGSESESESRLGSLVYVKRLQYKLTRPAASVEDAMMLIHREARTCCTFSFKKQRETCIQTIHTDFLYLIVIPFYIVS